MQVNSIAIHVWRLPMCRAAPKDGCAAQTNPTLNMTLTQTQTQPFWGTRGLLARSAGAVLSLRANLKTLHVSAIKRLLSKMCKLNSHGSGCSLNYDSYSVWSFPVPTTNQLALQLQRLLSEVRTNRTVIVSSDEHACCCLK